MSSYSLPTLRRISREELSSIILSPEITRSLAIFDVRDDDHVGGHIASSTHVPSSSLDYRIPEIVRKYANTDIVVFHCALSQQRGPSAALRYLRERHAKGYGVKEVKGNERQGKEDLVENVGVEGETRNDRETAVLKDAEVDSNSGEQSGKQEVYVLDGGFTKWQEL